ncbi:MAG: BREX-1 system adenine-specific DNA-methyltransferase PglX [Muribaculaceae bacterium]|nr:BREX-1 system adenine-specific DNA-methyltransferase PglX [Muribaculaceae bacterium]
MKLINHVLDIRRLIQQAFDNRFSRMGLRKEAATPVEQIPAEHQEKRRKLDELMSSHLSELGDYEEARQAAINECVFTLFNRIAAIKVMESKELFPEIITRRKENSGRSFEHNVWLENHPEERNAEREGLKHFLSDQFDSLGEHIPLYRKDYPYALLPTADELNEIIEKFNAVEEDADCGADVWKGDDILGWLYENFNAVEKEALKQSGEKTEYNKVSLQSQVYTPQWVVKFLVDNTLGKAYMEMFPDSHIKEKYQIANIPNHQIRHPKDLRQMRLLDPACGSGNFLIYAFSLFYDLYVDQMENYERDYSRRDIPKMIVENNLFGVDLDERAAQISQIALFIKARELGGHRSHWPAYTNVVSTHFFLDDYEKVKDTFEAIDNLDESKRNIMRMIWDDLSNAYKFGSLVRVDETLDKILPNDSNHNLFAQEQMEDMFSFKQQFMNQLRQKVNELGEVGSNAYTLAKTNDAISFLEIIANKYDVVVANPPYTDSSDFGTELKAFIEENYRRPLKFNTNLYACFIKRCCELAGDDGKVGMVNPPTFMYIKTFEDLRKYMLTETHISLFIEWGYLGMFSSFARVDSAMFILDKDNRKGESTFIKLNDLYEMKRKIVLFKAYEDLCNGQSNDRVYTLPQSKLKGIKSYPFIYWISDEFREKFGSEDLDNTIFIRQGGATGNNERTLRYFWEVDKNKISENPNVKKEYVFYPKGGPFRKWYGNNWVVLAYHNPTMYDYLKSHGNRLPSESFYLQEGVTYCSSGSRGCSFRYMPSNQVISGAGPGIYPSGKFDDIYYYLGFLNSTLSTYLLECLNPTVNVTQGDIKRVPFAVPSKTQQTTIHYLSKQNSNLRENLCHYSIIEPHYESSPLSAEQDINISLILFYNRENALLTQILLNESIINKTVFEVYELSEHDKQMVLDKEGIPVGDLPVSHEAKAAYKQWLMLESEFKPTSDVLEHLEYLEERDDLPKITDFDTLYQNNNEWEEFCIKRNVNPVEAWWQFKNANVLPPQRTQVLAFELITDVIRTVLAKDDDGIIPLGDRLGEERLAIRLEREMMERGYCAAQFSQVCQLLGCPLEKYLQERFFQQLSDHLNLFMYLPKTPFIWHLSSGEHHAIELYVSIYKWNRDALYRVRSIYAANREATLRDRLNSIDTSNTEGRMEAQELRATLTELQEFCQKVDDLLASGYDPKLDDGVGKNIAPLQKRKMLSYEVLNAGQLKKYLNADW